VSGTSEPVGIIGAGPFARALTAAVERAGRPVAACPDWHDAPILERLVEGTTLVFLAAHSDELVALARRLGEVCDGRHALVHPLRGLVGDALEPTSTILRAHTPVKKIGALGGPLVAAAMLDGRPSGGIVGSRFGEVCDLVRAALVSPSLRMYATDDLLGVELAACLMGVLAMGAGFSRAAGVGASASGVLLTRGVHEAATIATLWGARRETFFGLAGFGDLLAAVADDDRPEVRLGRLLGGGMPLAQVSAAVGGVPESVRIGTAVAAKAARAGIETPIFRALGEIATGRPPAEAIAELMRHERVRE
jgi:glycerol-3-phosphate dehydrogenase (NAD(P)+)